MASIKQGPSETLKAYVRRFNEELVTIHNPQENEVLMAALLGVRLETPFWDKLQKDECKMLQEFYRRADKIMRLKVVHAGKPTPTETPHETGQVGKSTPAEKSGKNKKHKSGNHRWSQEANNKKAKSPDQRVPRPPSSKYTNFTDLTGSREEVLLATEQTSVYKRPDSLQGDCSNRNQNKYC